MLWDCGRILVRLFPKFEDIRIRLPRILGCGPRSQWATLMKGIINFKRNCSTLFNEVLEELILPSREVKKVLGKLEN